MRPKRQGIEPYSIKTSDGRRLVYIPRRDGLCSVLDPETDASQIRALIDAAAKQRGRGRKWIRHKYVELGVSVARQPQVGFGQLCPQLQGKEVTP
jgi:hypothetical protein